VGRVQRQHRFMKALYERILHVETLSRLPALAKVIQEQVDTNVEVWDSANFAEVLQRLSREEPETIMLPGRPYAGDESIWLPDREQIKHKLQQLFPKADGNDGK